MENKRFWLGILVMILVFGMAVTGFVNAQTDARLNGTWKDDDGYIEKNNSGNFECSDENGLLSQGTYTTSNGKIISTATHVFGTQLGLDARWYSKEELGKKYSEYFETDTSRYVVDGNKLTYIDEYGATNTLTLVSRDGKFTQAAKYVPGSSGSVSSFPGRWKLIEGDGDAKDVELFKDGTGTADGKGITWKVENGRFHILHPFYTFSAYYNVTGSNVTFTKDDGEIVKYQKK
jgi:hypothetical protein